jgi:hypothetical protein
VVPVTSAGAHILDGADLVVVGGPTHTHGMSRPGTRKMAGKHAGKPGSEVELVPDAVSGPGVREWLASLGRLEVAGAAFDTRLQELPAFTGRASIARHWRKPALRVTSWHARNERIWVFMCPRTESPGGYIPAITGELVLRDSGDRAGRRLDQADDDRDVRRCWR